MGTSHNECLHSPSCPVCVFSEKSNSLPPSLGVITIPVICIAAGLAIAALLLDYLRRSRKKGFYHLAQTAPPSVWTQNQDRPWPPLASAVVLITWALGSGLLHQPSSDPDQFIMFYLQTSSCDVWPSSPELTWRFGLATWKHPII